MMTVGSLLTEPFQRHNIQVHSGHRGLTNKIDRVTVMEAKDSPTFYTGGELVLTTLYCVREDVAAQKNLVYTLSQVKAAGLIIKMDRYFNVLPDFFASEAEKYGFPILKIGQSVNYRDLIFDIYQFKLFHNKFYYDLKDLFIGSGSNINILKELKMDFKEAVIWVTNGDPYDIYYKALSNQLIVKLDKNLAGIIRINRKLSREEIASMVISEITADVNANVVVSQTVENMFHIRRIYQSTLASYNMLKDFNGRNRILFIEDYELETILLRSSISHKEDCLALVGKYVKPLIKYDLSYNNALVKTAEAFYHFSNIPAASKHLNIHPNTLRYRLNLIQTLVGIDTRKFEDNFKLYSALTYYRMLEARKRGTADIGKQNPSQ